MPAIDPTVTNLLWTLAKSESPVENDGLSQKIRLSTPSVYFFAGFRNHPQYGEIDQLSVSETMW